MGERKCARTKSPHRKATRQAARMDNAAQMDKWPSSSSPPRSPEASKAGDGGRGNKETSQQSRIDEKEPDFKGDGGGQGPPNQPPPGRGDGERESKDPSDKSPPNQSNTLQFIGSWVGFFGTLSAFLSALMVSGPCWMMITLCGPHMPTLFMPMMCAAAFRLLLVFCHLVRKALVDGELDMWEVCASCVRFASDVLVTMNAVFPQPVFITLIGGTFEGGDAARSFHMRMSRWLWRLTVRLPVEVVIAFAIFTYLVLPRIKAFEDVFKDLPPCLRIMGKGMVLSIFWTVLAARMKVLPLGFILGFDPSSSLASVVPDELLMFRRELSLYHMFTSSWPFTTALMVSLGDALMSNPTMSGYYGFVGSVMMGTALYWGGQPIQIGFWVTSAAWATLAITDYVFSKYNVEHLKFQGEDTIEIASFVDVDLEEDDDVPEDASGSRTNNAFIYLTIMGKRLRLDTLFKMLLLAVFLHAFYVEREKPFYLNPAVGWALWGAVWMFWLGTPKKCCLPWLSNGENC